MSVGACAASSPNKTMARLVGRKHAAGSVVFVGKLAMISKATWIVSLHDIPLLILNAATSLFAGPQAQRQSVFRSPGLCF